VSCPTLAIGGEMDIQVEPDVNMALIEQAFAAGGNDDLTVVTLPGLNHMLQPANTGLPAEYGVIETTIDPKALRVLSDWVAEKTGRSEN